MGVKDKIAGAGTRSPTGERRTPDPAGQAQGAAGRERRAGEPARPRHRRGRRRLPRRPADPVHPRRGREVRQSSDDVKDKAKETGQEALEHGKQVAQDAAQSAQETVKESGQEHAQEVKDSAQQNAQEAKAQQLLAWSRRPRRQRRGRPCGHSRPLLPLRASVRIPPYAVASALLGAKLRSML